ncbi:MAG: DUF11 domain-containing protein [Rhodothermia bacterium]|nr:DUF11 domain-containing protein [Rhodothermia bacterium]
MFKRLLFYALAPILFTSQQAKAQGPVLEADSLALVALYNATGGPNWKNNSGWLKDPVSKWYGITTYYNWVDEIQLSDNNLTGTLVDFGNHLSQNMYALYYVSLLDLSKNNLSGNVPKSIIRTQVSNNPNGGVGNGSLGKKSTGFYRLLLNGNNFTGNFPAEVEQVYDLSVLDISNNNFTGFLFNPQQMSIYLETVNLSNNQFDFADFEPNAGFFNQNAAKFIIAPQKTIGINRTQVANYGTNVSLGYGSINGQYNVFTWYKNNTVLPNSNQNPLLLSAVTEAAAGQYRYAITNSQVTGLTLGSGTINLLIRTLINQADSLGLVNLYNSTGGQSWLRKSNWLIGRVKDWEGVTINGDRVTGLALSSNNLNGSIPASFANLSALQFVNFANNNLSTGAANLPTTMLSVQLQNNQLSDLPNFSNFRSLQTLNVSNNNLTFEDFEPFAAWLVGKTFPIISPQNLFGTAENRTIEVGQSTSFTELVGGANNRYQWRRGQNNVQGAITNTLSFSNAQLNDSGSYYLEVTNTAVTGLTLRSRDKVLVVNDPFIDLELSKTVDNANPLAGNNLVYTITVRNTGNAAATGVTVRDLLPSGVSFVSASPTGVFANNLWTVGSVAPQASSTLRITARALQSHRNCAEVATAVQADIDSKPGNFNNGATNEDDDMCVEVTVTPRIDLEVSQTANPTSGIQGTTTSLRIIVVNKGPSPATNVELSQTKSANLTFLSGSPNKGTFNSQTGQWAIGELLESESVQLTITALLGEPGLASNVAQVSKATELDVDSTPGNNVQSEDDLSRVQINITRDTAPVIVSVTNFATPQPIAQPIVIRVQAQDDVGVAGAVLQFRRGGEAGFTSLTMTKEGTENNPATFVATIPATAVGIQGVEYFATVRDTKDQNVISGRRAIQAAIPSGNVSFISSLLVNGSDPAQFNFIATPHSLKETNIRALLEPVLGAYNPVRWRLFGQNPNNEELVELSEAELEFAPGAAFWLIFRDPLPQDILLGEATSVPLNNVFKRKLAPGWNMVGSPFAFDLPRANISAKSGQNLQIETFSPADLDEDGTPEPNWLSADVFSPFKGYIVANNLSGNQNDSLFVDPFRRIVTKTEVFAQVQPDWSIRFKAKVGNRSANEATLGIHQAASPQWDELDKAAPPILGPYLEVAFEHMDWDRPLKRYKTDIRPFQQEEQWEMSVRTSEKGLVHISSLLPEILPENLGVWAIDPVTKTVQDLRKKPSFTFVSQQENSVRKFKIRVGTQAPSVEIPQQSGLSSGYPNPFSLQTTLPLQLAEEATVHAEVFDLLGRRVNVLKKHEVLDAGFHTLVWDGKTTHGTVASNGIYLVRVNINSQTYVQRVTKSE